MARSTFSAGKLFSGLQTRVVSFVNEAVKIISCALKAQQAPIAVSISNARKIHNNRKDTAYRKKYRLRY